MDWDGSPVAEMAWSGLMEALKLSEAVKVAAMRSVGMLCLVLPNKSPLAMPILEEALKGRDSESRSVIIEAMGKVGVSSSEMASKVISFLEDTLDHGGEDAKLVAVDFLAKLCSAPLDLER